MFYDTVAYVCRQPTEASADNTRSSTTSPSTNSMADPPLSKCIATSPSVRCRAVGYQAAREDIVADIRDIVCVIKKAAVANKPAVVDFLQVLDHTLAEVLIHVPPAASSRRSPWSIASRSWSRSGSSLII